MVPRQPPPHFQLAIPAIIVLKKLFIILFLIVSRKTVPVFADGEY